MVSVTFGNTDTTPEQSNPHYYTNSKSKAKRAFWNYSIITGGDRAVTYPDIRSGLGRDTGKKDADVPKKAAP